MQLTFKGYAKLGWMAFKEWRADQTSRMSAALSYYAFFSFPAMIVVLALFFNLLLSDQQYAFFEARFVAQLATILGNDNSMLIRTVVGNLLNQPPGVAAVILSLGGLLFLSTNVFVQLRGDLNSIWKDFPRQNTLTMFFQNRLVSLAVIGIIGVLALTFLFTSTFIATASNFFSSVFTIPHIVIDAVNISLSLLIFTILFALIYKILPDVSLDWNDVFLGALVTAVFFVIGEIILGAFLRMSGLSSVYGAASSLVIVLIWLYVTAQLFFYGAEFTKVYASTHGSHSTKLRRKLIAPTIT